MVYNAWNQLVAVKDSAGQVIAQYAYNAMGYRVTETYPLGGPGIPAPAGTTKYLYYSSQEQVIEERWGSPGTAEVHYQYVWSASYVNAMILRDTYVNGEVLPADRIYTTYDANFDVTSLIGYDSTTQWWGVVERFAYSPYGTVTDLAPGWFSQSDQLYWQYMYQGGRQDPITQLYRFDHRDYSASLGTWTSQDPLQYINGANTYQFVESSPVNWVDPSGQSVLGAVGGVVGGAIGAVLGALGGGAAGTAVEPGGGTVIGTGLGGYEGATTGAAIGAGAGIILGNGLHDLGELFWHFASRPGSSLPSTGTPNGSKCEDRGNGQGTIRDYDDKGNAQTDYDFGHDHGSGDPHAHDWTNGSRGPGRPLKPGE